MYGTKMTPEWANRDSITGSQMTEVSARTYLSDYAGEMRLAHGVLHTQIPCRHARRVHKAYIHCSLKGANVNDACIHMV